MRYSGDFGRLGIWLLILAAIPQSALGHDGRPHSFDEVWLYWGNDPLTIFSLTILAIMYSGGIARLWKSASTGKGIRIWEAVTFGIGWLSLFVALLSPLHPLGEVLFSAHMTQHEILMLVSAPLLVLGRPLIAFMWFLPVSWREGVAAVTRTDWVSRWWRTVSTPLAAWLIHLLVLWIWHIPALFQATLSSDLVHFFQHFCFLASAILFWWALIYGAKGILGYGAAVLYVFSTAAHSGLLGALLTFATSHVYPEYAHTTAAFGLTAMEDQQLGGLIMWVPAGFLYTIAALALLAGWIKEAEERSFRSGTLAMGRAEIAKEVK